MRILRNATIFLFIGLVTLFAIGCEEQQLERADQIVTDANSVVATGGAILQSPAGALLPPGFQLYGAVGLAIASVLLNAWQKVRSNLLTKTTKAIVKGIEASEKETKPNPANPIKAAIAKQMIQAGIYSQADDLINQLKASR